VTDFKFSSTNVLHSYLNPLNTKTALHII